ncbi:4'-phosphopantetheinyl transferase EntD [Streptomyces olivoverticillatus]|uniref:4'-phosphopantetheinyl transferase EntD n=1 Tax=Streptomyces olivoverticillatus TaxID=66427 RepID=A0A7W7LM47_9ACTN|nr:4'-phosphopantetheinyl transferase superfamily protein [Streptomyces olivoverticillatus]MBB4892312.1 4'-phosphopantetheinyl transferase EntD [Streptomyces olivoverticillatus]
MIENLLPPQVAAVEATCDRMDVVLFPEEEAQIAGAVDKRRREFTTARWCARRAMGQLGLPAVPVLPGTRGAPRWQPSVVGSITHCAGYRAAALARTSDVAAIGIDAEPNQPLPEGVLESIGLPRERAWVRELQRTTPQVAWDRLLFSMKESVYKAWYPLRKRPLEFEDALITVDPRQGTFQARLLLGPAERRDGDPLGFEGRWSAVNGVALSAIAVPALVPAAPAAAWARAGAPHRELVGSAR